jgi:chromosome segregation protein
MKCDLQVHSPRDRNWSGEKFAGGGEEAEAKRHEWAKALVAACVARALSVVAITDHHDFAFIPYIQKAIEEAGLKDDLVLFPGTEVTCNDSSQCIVLFDPDSDEALWDQMFGLLPHVSKPDPNSQSGDLIDLCGLDIGTLLISLTESRVLAGKFIALPNASKSGCHKTVLRDGFHERFAGLAADGVYSDHPHSAYRPGDLRIIQGLIVEWGTRRRGILPTGDNRSRGFEKLGVNPCWIKLGAPTTEGIRQALLADEARVRYEPPIYAAQRITGMTISSALTGQMKLTFNEGFNSIIGGRGSGKSALLEYIRFGLGRSAVDSASGPERSRERELLQSTLAGGSVSLQLDRNGVSETWHREGASSTISVRVQGSPEESISTDEAHKRFRARAFSQKQLSTLIRTSEDAAEQITGIAAAQSVDRRRDIEQEIVEIKRGVQRGVSTMVDYWTAEALHDSAIKNVTDLRRRIESLKEKLQEEGLSPEQRAVLERAPKFDLAEALLPEAAKALNSDLEQVTRISLSVPSVDISRREEVIEFTELNDFYEKLETARSSIAGRFKGVEADLRSLMHAQESAAASFALASADFLREHSSASSGQKRLASLISESNGLAKELQEAESKQRQQKAILDSLTSAPAELEASKVKLTEASNRLRALLQTAATEVSALSSGVLRASVREESEPNEFVATLDLLCEQSYVKESQSRCLDRVKKVMSEGHTASWGLIRKLTMEVLKERVQGPPGPVAQIGAESADRLSVMLFSLTPQQSARIFERIDAFKVGSLLSALPRCFIEFEYKDGNRYIPFVQASQGQQAAALLDLLLRQEAGTLIIDQPEDDLDNRVIMDVANLLHSSKMGRQLVFTTHNANFVVNGDSDKVIGLAAGAPADALQTGSGFRVQIEVDGAIDTTSVRRMITDTLEGGKEAFDLRARKYQFLRN